MSGNPYSLANSLDLNLRMPSSQTLAEIDAAGRASDIAAWSGVSSQATGAASDFASASLWMQAGTMISQMACGIISALAQSELMEKQFEMQKGALKHQENIAEINKDITLDNLKEQEKRQAIAEKGQKQLNESEKELKEAKGEVEIVEASIAEDKKTEKTGEIDEKLVSYFFDDRDDWGYGDPQHA